LTPAQLNRDGLVPTPQTLLTAIGPVEPRLSALHAQLARNGLLSDYRGLLIFGFSDLRNFLVPKKGLEPRHFGTF
jgi:hypothetical protein